MYSLTVKVIGSSQFKSSCISYLLLTLLFGSGNSLTMERDFHAGLMNATVQCHMPKACDVPGFKDWFKVGLHCVKYFNNTLNFTEAEFSCIDSTRGAHLASVHNASDNNHLLCIVKKFNPTNRRVWIGGFRLLQSHRFLWLDGSAWNYDEWVPGEPNHNFTNEECVELNWKEHGKWNDKSCFVEKSYICAFEAKRIVKEE
ncbi:galactose-specific lectin nattectin-like [Danio aesculapii]|uniref:galactose-specific lectin nattectin-like n=1 Tax=Danio aesculapii TaxID=1142201 RepID=UPI0024BFCB3D|nr:galactose-specific lectin nattectin-like [Danio aesculapii]